MNPQICCDEVYFGEGGLQMYPQIYKSVNLLPQNKSILGKEVDRFLESPDLLPQNILEPSSTPVNFFAGIKC